MSAVRRWKGRRAETRVRRRGDSDVLGDDSGVPAGDALLLPPPDLECGVGDAGYLDGLGLYSKSLAADEVADDDALSAAVAVFEADHDHAVALETAAPALVAVFGRDLGRGDEFEVAGGADGVVAVVALWAVEARCGGLDREVADAAEGAEC